MVVRELMTRFSGDSSSFRRSADEVKQELTKLTTEYNTNRRGINELQKQINSEVKELNNLKNVIAQTNGGTEEQRRRCEELEQSINNATIRMSQMQTAQAELRQQMSEVTSELRNQNTETIDISKSFSDFCNICKAGVDILSKVSKALIDTTLQSAYMTDTLNTLSAQTGISTQDLQKYQYAQNLIDVSLSDYTSGVNKATQAIKKYQSGNAEVISALDDLKVSIYDSEGALKDSNIVFNDIIEALGKIGDSAEQDVYAMTLLGKNAVTYATLINGGAETLKKFGDELERNGLILNNIQTQDLQNVQDSLDSLKSKAQALTNVISASAAPAVSEILEIIDDIIMDINNAIQKGELQPYIDLITGMLKTLAKMLKTGINILIDWKELVIGIGIAFASWKILSTIQGVIKGLKEAEIAQKAFNAVANQNPYILIASVIIGAITSIIAKIKTATNETNTFNRAISQLDDTVNDMTGETKTNIEQVKLLAQEYEKLRVSTEDTTDKMEKLAIIGGRLKELIPDYIDSLQDETGAYIDLKDAISEATTAMQNQLELDIAKAKYEKYIELLADLQIEYDKLSGEINNHSYKETGSYMDLKDYNKKENERDGIDRQLSEVKALLEQASNDYTNLIKDNNKSITENIKNTESSILDTINAYKNLEDKLKTVTAAEEEFAEKGRLTASTLADVAEKYPILEESIKKYINGSKSEIEILGELSKAYNDDYNNYNSEIKAKIGKNEELYSKLVNSNADIINTLKKQYKIDLTNYQTYNDAKYAIANKTLSKICADWAKYYDAETNSYTALYSQLYHDNPELAGQISNAVVKYKILLSELESKLTEFATTDYASASKSNSVTATADKTISKFDIANEAYKKLVNDRIAMIEKLRDTQVNAIQDQIDAIDAEIKARERLKEDTSIQDEIDAINAKLKYAQIDDFTRYELEKQLKELYQQQEDIAFERNAEDRKNTLNNQMEDIKNSAAESIDALNQAMTTASEFFTENKNGYKSASQIVNNNSKSANINIINNALTSDQIATAIVKKLYD